MFILFAQINENEIESYRVKLDDSSPDKVFNDLREIILNISKVESFIHNEYKKAVEFIYKQKLHFKVLFYIKNH